MATIVGGIATSHTPTIGFALDTHKQSDPVWAPIFEAYKPVQAWLAQKRPDVLLFIYNDHVTSFFLDHYSQFALGRGKRVLPRRRGRRSATAAAGQGAPEARAAPGQWPGGRRV